MADQKSIQFDKKIDKYAYSMNHVLGKGSYGQVVLGLDSETNKLVAVKVIDLSKAYKHKDKIKLLNREIQILQNVQSDNIIKLFDVIQSQSSPNIYMFLDYCPEGDLKRYIKAQGGRLTFDRAFQLFLNIVNGFKTLQQNCIIHRDIKPANIMIKNNKALIGDFGFARYLDIPMEQQSDLSLLGTPLYMSPQIIRGDIFSSKCDVWSVAILFYQMIYGQPPFYGVSKEALYNNMENKSVTFPKEIAIPVEIKDLIFNMLGFEEEKRFSWKEVFQHPALQPERIVLYNSMVMEMSQQSTTTGDEMLSESNELPDNQAKEEVMANKIKNFNDDLDGGIRTLQGKK